MHLQEATGTVNHPNGYIDAPFAENATTWQLVTTTASLLYAFQHKLWWSALEYFCLPASRASSEKVGESNFLTHIANGWQTAAARNDLLNNPCPTNKGVVRKDYYLPLSQDAWPFEQIYKPLRKHGARQPPPAFVGNNILLSYKTRRNVKGDRSSTNRCEIGPQWQRAKPTVNCNNRSNPKASRQMKVSNDCWSLNITSSEWYEKTITTLLWQG